MGTSGAASLALNSALLVTNVAADDADAAAIAASGVIANGNDDDGGADEDGDGGSGGGSGGGDAAFKLHIRLVDADGSDKELITEPSFYSHLFVKVCDGAFDEDTQLALFAARLDSNGG
jgi:hypothetical protein